MPLNANTLRPYKSLLLVTVPKGITLGTLARTVCIEISDMVSTGATKSAVSTPAPQAGLNVAFLDYSEKKQVSWTTATKEDALHHLVVVCRRKRQIAVMVTDTSLRDKVCSKVGSHDGSIIGRLRPIGRGTLNAAYVIGKTKTLWLANTRRGGSAAVDSKVLAGEDLQFALDPLGDRTAHGLPRFSVAGNSPTHGISPFRAGK